jgi:hypothetical protein
MTHHHHSLMREATDAGFLGTIAVLLWFLLLDSLAGQPFRTPNQIGQMILGGTPGTALNFVAIVAFVVLSLLLLNLLAAIIVGLVHWAIRQPTLLFALLLLFVMFEVFFFGASYAILRGAGMDAPWLPLLGANVVAVLTMGWYLRRKHQLIGRWLARVPLGDTGDEQEVNTPAAWEAMGHWRTPWWRRLLGAPARRGG